MCLLNYFQNKAIPVNTLRESQTLINNIIHKISANDVENFQTKIYDLLDNIVYMNNGCEK